MNLGEKIYKKRKIKGYSQEKLAELAGVSRQTVYKWESNYVQPTQDNLNILCELLDVNLGYFYEENFTSDKLHSTDNTIAAIAGYKSNKKLLILIIVNAIILFFMVFATVCIGYIAFPTNTGDSVVTTRIIDPSIFVIMVILSSLDLCAEISLIIKLLGRKHNVNQK